GPPPPGVRSRSATSADVRYGSKAEILETSTSCPLYTRKRTLSDTTGMSELQDIPLPRGQSPSGVIKGGSYLCSSNYCSRYRPAARQPQEIDLGAGHLGFRTVLNRPGGKIP